MIRFANVSVLGIFPSCNGGFDFYTQLPARESTRDGFHIVSFIDLITKTASFNYFDLCFFSYFFSALRICTTLQQAIWDNVLKTRGSHKIAYSDGCSLLLPTKVGPLQISNRKRRLLIAIETCQQSFVDLTTALAWVVRLRSFTFAIVPHYSNKASKFYYDSPLSFICIFKFTERARLILVFANIFCSKIGQCTFLFAEPCLFNAKKHLHLFYF